MENLHNQCSHLECSSLRAPFEHRLGYYRKTNFLSSDGKYINWNAG